MLANSFPRFGKLKLHGTVRVGKDRTSWQELECYLFAEMLICVKEKKNGQNQFEDPRTKRKMTRCTLKGSILIKKHLKDVESVPGNISRPPWSRIIVPLLNYYRGTYFDPQSIRCGAAMFPPPIPES